MQSQQKEGPLTRKTFFLYAFSIMLRGTLLLQIFVNDNLKQVVDAYNDCISEYIAEVSEQAFCDGFSLGMKLLSEALWENENNA